ncbi:MAG: nucleoside triphosphate pyrophosphohydrolase [Verrucomicrobiae bacterium]|nr:nucleoside triphosphate pyrophosphohydrolase [Verrucomicrobiae bacterium]
MPRSRSQIARVLKIMARLRAPGGCPWDREQTHHSLRYYAVEEVYELIDAIETRDDAGMLEELGDLLLQVVFHAQMARERRRFDFEDVARVLADKLLARHPHVFGNRKARTPGQVLAQWHALKHAEKGHQRPSVTDGVPRHLPALMRAQEVQKKVARVGFDWADAAGVLDKIEEELRELRRELGRRRRRKVAEELGDLLFALVNLARFHRFDAEDLLNQCTKKFITRFRKIEAAFASRGRKLSEATLEEMETEWQKAKNKARGER